jgi:hypothetical protein
MLLGFMLLEGYPLNTIHLILHLIQEAMSMVIGIGEGNSPLTSA